MLFGFPHDPNAPATAYLNNLFLYLLFAVPHLLMTRSAFKRWVWGTPSGSPAERRTYIVVAILTWIAVLLVQWPTPGPVVDVPEPLRFVAMVGFLYFFARGFEGVTLPMLDGLLAVPGAATSFSHGPETPLFMEGQYAEVRHPMYRAAILGGLCTLVIHPHLGQLVWSFMIGATLVGFVPIEEAQLLAARGEIYRDYQRRTPYRIFRGIW
jgi:protein-S-isoprenylcysteine O-methyltransferase Ste14